MGIGSDNFGSCPFKINLYVFPLTKDNDLKIIEYTVYFLSDVQWKAMGELFNIREWMYKK